MSTTALSHHCPACAAGTRRTLETTQRLVSGFLTVEQVDAIEAQLCDAYGLIPTPDLAARCCPDCLATAMAGAV